MEFDGQQSLWTVPGADDWLVSPGKDDEVVKLLELRFKLCVVGVEADGTDVEKGGGVQFGLDGSVDN